MELAIDQEALREVVLGGLAVPLAGVSSLNSGYEDTKITQREYDPERARELLDWLKALDPRLEEEAQQVSDLF